MRLSRETSWREPMLTTVKSVTRKYVGFFEYHFMVSWLGNWKITLIEFNHPSIYIVYDYERLYNSAVGARLGNSIVQFGLCTYLVFKHFFLRWIQWRDYVSRSYPECWWFSSRDLTMTGKGQTVRLKVWIKRVFICISPLSSHFPDREYIYIWCDMFVPSLQGDGCKI